MRNYEKQNAMHSRLPLTLKQQETIAYAAVGLSFKQIACVMSISTYTVRVHLAKAQWKLGAWNIRQACALYAASWKGETE